MTNSLFSTEPPDRQGKTNLDIFTHNGPANKFKLIQAFRNTFIKYQGLGTGLVKLKLLDIHLSFYQHTIIWRNKTYNDRLLDIHAAKLTLTNSLYNGQERQENLFKPNLAILTHSHHTESADSEPTWWNQTYLTGSQERLPNKWYIQVHPVYR